jgi:hypothetical protein
MGTETGTGADYGQADSGTADAVCGGTRRRDGRLDRWLDEEAYRVSSRADLREAARSAGADWLATLAPWDLYATLTYDRRKWYVDAKPPSSQVSISHLHSFVRRAGQALHRPVLAVSALENTQAGWPHWHGMLASGGLDESQFALLSSLWYEPHGYAKFYRVRQDTSLPIAKYITKYLTKESASVEFAESDGAKWGGLQWTLTRNSRLNAR